jgi:PHD/YefM family antitoxin component YafN of YafNO toxin-antitoxin module
MIKPQDIHSLSDFQRKAREHIRRLKETGRPEVLTVNGRAEVVMQDATAYQQLLDTVERAEAIAGIRRGLDSVARGEGRSVGEAFDALRQKHGSADGG